MPYVGSAVECEGVSVMREKIVSNVQEKLGWCEGDVRVEWEGGGEGDQYYARKLLASVMREKLVSVYEMAAWRVL